MLHNRSEGSIEFKHQNISAVLINLGLPFITGYKSQFNYQKLLEKVIVDHLVAQEDILEPQFLEFAKASKDLSKHIDFANIQETPPKCDSILREPQPFYGKSPLKANYLELEQKNLALGKTGEELILKYEKWRLNNLEKPNLADQIEWIAQYDDRAGFDILSKNVDGTDRYIEVKTTKLSKEAPFYFSKNEYEFSKMKKDSFHLYRVINTLEKPRFFSANGGFDDFCNKEAINYRGFF